MKQYSEEELRILYNLNKTDNEGKDYIFGRYLVNLKKSKDGWAYLKDQYLYCHKFSIQTIKSPDHITVLCVIIGNYHIMIGKI